MNNAIRLSVRTLVEFLLQHGSIDNRYTGADRAGEGSRIHRKLQKEAGAGYAACLLYTSPLPPFLCPAARTARCV